MKIINMITNPVIFKISAALMISTLGLMIYNRHAFIEHTGNIGIAIFISSLLLMSMYLFVIMFFSKSIDIERRISISTYFVLSGIAYILSSLWKFYNNTFDFSGIEGNFLLLNIGYLLYGSYMIYRDEIYKKEKSILWKNASILAPFYTLIIQLYIGNINYYNDIIFENPIVNSVKLILLAGPST